ncbi:PEP-CTERM sorting domain-containing protein [Mariniblastus fucicola]|uniref:Ice-binding protein C-terminal domain-containing protein n=1 Tax=Mariniblastus fucicola TaxID=980251 RepID=A0A5B9PBX3_9BACT|nr:PEP-CTERM sorting domain-containing protein [Mariniblastus fucicola]QEG22550.1 hypothetical protein MFFC18_24330 [Mariniblastus fucicola]
MKFNLVRLSAIALLLCFSAQVNAETLTSVFSAQVEEDEIDAFSGDVDQAFFNVQGDDDQFTVYSFADFDTAGIGAVSDIAGLSMDLAQSNAAFSADGALEFFLATDTRVVDLNDTARYITDGDNVGSEVVGSAFGTLYSLGSGTYTVTNTADVDTFNFTLDSAGKAFAISQINSGGLLRIIATPGDLGVQATYSGAGSILDPVAPPVLNFTTTAVPEPSSAAVLGLIAFAGFCRRRR